MEDLRIQKTRKALKQALIKLLSEKSFEKISVTDICKESSISRITFYTHYDHKYDLAQEIFTDYMDIGRNVFQSKETKIMDNTQSKNDIQNFTIFVDCVSDIIVANPNFFRPILEQDNPYLLSVFTNILLDTVEKLVNQHETVRKTRYSSRQITGFLIYGIAGFVKEAKGQNIPFSKTKEDVKQLMTNILEQGIIYE